MFDLFGKSVGLTMNGESTYKTFIGGVVTLLITAMCVFFTILQSYYINIGYKLSINSQINLVSPAELNSTFNFADP